MSVSPEMTWTPTELREYLSGCKETMRAELQPRDEFEEAVLNALGDISWDEAIAAINDHRLKQVGVL